MKNIVSTLAACALMLLTASCGNSTSGDKAAADSTETPIPALENLDAHQLIAWKASEGMPLYPEEIDTIVAYFAEPDRWTTEKLKDVKTPEQFDSVENLYIKQFPYIEMYSMVLEQYADQISDSQMERLQATAISLGETVDRAAKAAGIDPEEAKAAAQLQAETTE